MRKLTLMFFWLGTAAFAQKGSFELGLSAGINSAKVSNADDQSFLKVDSKYGLNIGLSADYFLTDHWSVKTRLAYDEKGLDGHFLRRPLDQASGFAFRDINSDFKLTYLTVPVTVNRHFGKTFDFSIGLGGYVGFLLDSNEEDHQSLFGTSRKFSETDFGVVGTIAVKYPLAAKLKIGLQYEFQQGLSELYNPNPATSPQHFNSRHNLSVGCYYVL